MAQTKTQTRARKGSQSKSPRRSGSSGSRASARRSANSNRTRSSARNSSKSRARTTRSRGSNGSPNGARETITRIASKAKVPAVAAGGALAGLAGGAVLARRNSTHKVLGVPMPRFSGARRTTAEAFGDAAREIGKAGYQVGRLTNEVRRVRERVDN